MKQQLLFLLGFASTACAGGAMPAAPVAEAPTIESSCSGPPPSSENACLEPSCDGGKWSLGPVGPRVVCELSDNYAERQGLAFHWLRGDPGVCSAGECVPRLVCAERCGAQLGTELQPIYDQLRACRAGKTDRAELARCDEATTTKGAAFEAHLGNKLIACAVDCGYPAPRAATEVRPPNPDHVPAPREPE